MLARVARRLAPLSGELRCASARSRRFLAAARDAAHAESRPAGGREGDVEPELEGADEQAADGSAKYGWLLTDSPEKKEIIDTMLRVDHAGELGAAQIYSGQLAVFGGTPVGNVLQEMKDQEQHHLDTFTRLLEERRVRPTALMPIWNVAGYALGLSTAIVGKEAAMACTVAVEEVIAEHYNDQVRKLLEAGFEEESELRSTFRQFRDEELEHKDTGLEHDAERAPLYRAMSEIIKAGCRGAIFLTERI